MGQESGCCRRGWRFRWQAWSDSAAASWFERFWPAHQRIRRRPMSLVPRARAVPIGTCPRPRTSDGSNARRLVFACLWPSGSAAVQAADDGTTSSNIAPPSAAFDGGDSPAVAFDDGTDDGETEATARRHSACRTAPHPPCKNDRTLARRCSGGMPGPVSRTTIRTPFRHARRSSTTRPPGGVCRMALAARFCSACSRRAASPRSPACPARCSLFEGDVSIAQRRLVPIGHTLEQILTATGSLGAYRRRLRAAPGREGRR